MPVLLISFGMASDQHRLAEQLDIHLREALLMVDTLEEAGVRQGIGGLALRQLRDQVEQAIGWSTGVVLHVGRG